MTVKVYHLNEKEVHMMGEYVGVVWNLRTTSRTEKTPTTIRHISEKTKTGNPFIDFVYIRDDNPDDVYEDEDSPVAGGLDPKQAITVAIELKYACDYIQNKGWENRT